MDKSKLQAVLTWAILMLLRLQLEHLKIVNFHKVYQYEAELNLTYDLQQEVWKLIIK